MERSLDEALNALRDKIVRIPAMQRNLAGDSATVHRVRDQALIEFVAAFSPELAEEIAKQQEDCHFWFE